MIEVINNIYNFLDDKKILIFGFGREGKATYNFIRNKFKDTKIYILDKKVIEKMDDENVEIILDSEYEKYFDKFDIIIKSPGVSIKSDIYEKYKHKITSQTSLFLEFSKNKIIGITGTKGKSTTSFLIYHILKTMDIDCKLVGNIGTPIFSEINEINEDTILVFEMSSHQLQHINKSPKIAVLLNIYEEHLDYYESFDDYIVAKENIYKFQNEEDFFVYNANCKNVDLNKINNVNQRKLPIYINSENNNEKSCVNIYEDKIIFNINNKKTEIDKKDIVTSLKGDHNIYNICVAIGVCSEIGISIEDILKSISTFKGLEHRIEFVGKYNDINFYNDSIATIPEATMCAVNSFERVNTIIIGGKDRGVNYSELARFLDKSEIGKVLFIGESGQKIYSLTNKDTNKYIYADNLEEAVKLAKIHTPKDGMCILSPASASFGYYKNFEERGNVFKDLVKK